MTTALAVQPLHSCCFCPQEFPTKGALKRHKRDAHMEKMLLASKPHIVARPEWKDFLHHDRWHPAADLMPMCNQEDFARLVEDIKTNGLKVPVVLFGGKVLDGRNRLKACAEAGVTPTFITLDTEFDPAVPDNGFDPVSWVLSTNLSRRQLTKSQVACMLVDAGELMERLTAEAKTRQGTRTDIVEIVPPSSAGKTRDKLGALGGVSGRYVGEASAVKKTSPQLFEKVKNGVISLRECMNQNAGSECELKAKFGGTPPEYSFDQFCFRMSGLLRDTRTDNCDHPKFIRQVDEILKVPVRDHWNYKRAHDVVSALLFHLQPHKPLIFAQRRDPCSLTTTGALKSSLIDEGGIRW